MHSAVYDVVHQILTGNVESGLNRELVISLFRDAKLMQRIVEAQKLNDLERFVVTPLPFSLTPTTQLPPSPAQNPKAFEQATWGT